MKAVFLDWATMGPGLEISRLRGLLPELEIFDVTTDEQVAARITDASYVLTNKIHLTDELLDRCKDLEFIGLTATGTDNVDLDAAQRHNIAVCNIRAYCTRSVAEHVFACLLSLTHSLRQYSEDVRAGEWQKSADFGIVGYGNLGRAVARIAGAFGMTVLVAERPGATGDGRVPFDEMLTRADVISLHCPLVDETRNLFGEEQFRRMKSSAIFINTARGGLVDSAALAAALRRGDIAAAAIDVLPKEPPVAGDPLLDYDGDNLIVTPHIAWATNEARQAAIDELTENIAAFQQGRERNRVV
jgi:glycerate dehydrogenase